MNSIRLTWTCLSVLALLIVPSLARAGDQSRCSTPDYDDYPVDGATDIPLNTVLLYRNLDPGYSGDTSVRSTVSLRDPNDDEISTHSTTLAAPGCVPVFQPDQPLEPDTTYEVVADDSGILATFTTGQARDDATPDFLPGEDSADAGVYLEYEYSVDLIVVATDYPIEEGIVGVGLAPDGVLDLGTEAAEVPEGTELTVVALDRGGNKVERTVIVRSPVDDAAGCSCAQQGAGRGSSLSYAALLLIWLARLARRHEP